MTNSVLLLLEGWGEGLLINKCNQRLGGFVYLMILLTVWLMVYTYVVSKGGGIIATLFLTMNCFVVLTFKTKSLLLFYMCFEASVIPIALLIFLFGYQPEKLQACFFLLVYTVSSRLPLLITILRSNENIPFIRSLLSIPVTLAFMVKTPMYILHMWLPKAHVEAPIGGSMVLAGVLLKLGSYGLLLFLPFVKLNFLLVAYVRVSLVGSFYCSIFCLRQGDLKVLIAYSSVVHMGVVTLGFVRGSELGYSCSLIIIFSHGLCSPFLFLLAHWMYNSSHSRLLLNNITSWPISTAMLFGVVRLNIGIPPRLSIWAEVLLSVSVLHVLRYITPVLISIFFLGTIYNLYLYTSCSHSKFSPIKPLDLPSFLPVLQVLFYGYRSFLTLDLFHLYF